MISYVKSAWWHHRHCHHALLAMCNVSASSVQLILIWYPEMLHLQYRGGFHAGPGPHYNGGWWWHHHYTAWHTVEHMCASCTLVQDIIIMYSAGPVQVAWTRRIALSPSFLTLASVTVAVGVWQVTSARGLGSGNKLLPDPQFLDTDRWNLCCDVIAIIAQAIG